MKVERLTPPGPGGVALLRCDGEGAEAFLTRAFGELPAPGRVAHGWIRDSSGEPLDEVLLTRVSSQAFELGCHAGPAVVERLLEAFRQGGAVEARPDPLLARAVTELGCRVLLTQRAGALGLAVRKIEGSLEAGRVDSARTELEALLATAPFGLGLVDPPTVALVGRPNAGKSSLMNALLGRERVIVTSQAGTTRDAVEELCNLDGFPVFLIDTAGDRDDAGELEGLGIERARQVAGAAACRVHVVDASAAGEPPDVEHPRVVALNKVDLVKAPGPAPDGAHWVSALTGEGLPALRGALRRALVGEPTENGAVVCDEASRDALAEALKALAAGEPGSARARLAGIQG